MLVKARAGQVTGLAAASSKAAAADHLWPCQARQGACNGRHTETDEACFVAVQPAPADMRAYSLRVPRQSSGGMYIRRSKVFRKAGH